jgi:hypothetical protein
MYTVQMTVTWNVIQPDDSVIYKNRIKVEFILGRRCHAGMEVYQMILKLGYGLLAVEFILRRHLQITNTSCYANHSVPLQFSDKKSGAYCLRYVAKNSVVPT